MSEPTEKPYAMIEKTSPTLVQWTFQPGEQPMSPAEWTLDSGAERYNGEDVVMVRRFAARNGWSRDTYRQFTTWIPRAKAEALYRDLIRKGFKLAQE
ncbi:MAG: hypothetical protein FJ304_22825 [Planctomycetes bacterium]|nr:hypothetical protein [Planctomycetota bacterium]